MIGRDNMPRFMDFHDDLQLPPEAIDQIAQGTREGATDEFGVRQVKLYHNADGTVYCLLAGPDEEAIRQHPAALNGPCGDAHQVNSLLWDGGQPAPGAQVLVTACGFPPARSLA